MRRVAPNSHVERHPEVIQPLFCVQVLPNAHLIAGHPPAIDGGLVCLVARLDVGAEQAVDQVLDEHRPVLRQQFPVDFLLDPLHLIGQVDPGQHPVHPGVGQQNGLNYAAHLSVGQVARHGAAPVDAVPFSPGTLLLPVVPVAILNRVLTLEKLGHYSFSGSFKNLSINYLAKTVYCYSLNSTRYKIVQQAQSLGYPRCVTSASTNRESYPL